MRSLRTAWLSALFLGFTGGNRFYLRRPVTGTLKLPESRGSRGGSFSWWFRLRWDEGGVHAFLELEEGSL